MAAEHCSPPPTIAAFWDGLATFPVTVAAGPLEAPDDALSWGHASARLSSSLITGDLDSDSLPDTSSPLDSSSCELSATLHPVVQGAEEFPAASRSGDSESREIHEAICFARSLRGAAGSEDPWQSTHGPVSELQAAVAELWTIHQEQRHLATRQEQILAELEALLHQPLPAAEFRGRGPDVQPPRGPA